MPSMKNRFLIFAGMATLIIIAGGLYLTYRSSPPQLPAPENYEYYWSSSCSGCKSVAEFFKGWDKTNGDTIKIDKFNVNDSQQNTLRFLDRGNYCNIPKADLGMPLLITPKGFCLSGDQQIIKHLKNLDAKQTKS